MHQELTEKYGISLLYKELPNSIYGFYTKVKKRDYIVLNIAEKYPNRQFSSIALLYFYHTKQPHILSEHYQNDEHQLKAIEFAKDYFLKRGLNGLSINDIEQFKNSFISAEE